MNCVQMLLEFHQACCHDCFPGELVPILYHPLSEEPSPNTQSLMQPHSVPWAPKEKVKIGLKSKRSD